MKLNWIALKELKVCLETNEKIESAENEQLSVTFFAGAEILLNFAKHC